ncbi:hypothetical protein [Demequina muriae]|uniref:WD40 repeat domain-containing protein n=1 Tax=Demequina muriae TaxID=3051664 RepID=A0ABT8GGQ2_9MICO|nr:hypothetical protein [Demequina sp. EGI L300058]MDN4480614.1 hypothetical protein [Demequina sp. EGI L300058]
MSKGGRSNDAGRFPVGVVIAIAVVGLAGFGAYWLLGEYGFIGDPSADATASPEAESAIEDDGRPEWLQGTAYELPPMTSPENELEPPARILEGWVWELVDEDWSLTVVREGEGDNYTWLSDFQALYLVSPTDDRFKISDLRTDFDMDLVHWDPELQVSWIKRGGKSDFEQVIEYDLISLDSTEDWSGSVVSSANVVEGGVANVEYRGDVGEGRELWVSYDPSGYATGVFWRDGTEWEPSLITDQIRRMAQQGFSRERGVDAWFDPASERAVYHGVFIDPDTQRLADEMWVVHDLATEEFDDTVVVAVPRDDCAPVDGPRSGTFEGDRIVALCGDAEYLLDPYGNAAPVER